METLLQSRSLVARAYWLVKLRWIAVALLGVATFFSTRALHIKLPVVPLYVIAGAILVYNYLLFDLLSYFTWGGKSVSHTTISRIITFQTSADLFILTIILHYSGGIENPFFLYFVFHMIIASILLSKWKSYLQATLGVLLFGGMVLLEYLEIIHHYRLGGFINHNLYHNGVFVFGTLAVFSTTLYLVVYMTTSISAQLRKQQKGCEQTNILLKEKDNLKNEYVLRLTHDIRGHLAAIQSCLGIVGDQIVGQLNDKQMDLVQRAHHRAVKCMAFITALLKLTRMKLTGQLDMEKFSLRNSVFNALAAVQNRASGKSISIDYDIEASVDEIYGEPVLIEETIVNLLFNAVKYTPEKGNVKVSVKDQRDYVLIQIRDNGIGIPPDEVDKIFDEFYRAGNARKIEREGTGLGLSIAKQVLERHNGKIWAENNQDGGSTFGMMLPKNSEES